MSAANSTRSRRASAASIGPGPEPPEEPVVGHHQLGPLRAGALEQLQLGAHAGGNRGHLLRARYLQAVGTVVREAPGLQQSVELRHDVC